MTNTMAGITSKFSKWTPMAKPIMKAIRIIQRRLCGWSATASQRSIAQNVTAVKNEDMA